MALIMLKKDRTGCKKKLSLFLLTPDSYLQLIIDLCMVGMI